MHNMQMVGKDGYSIHGAIRQGTQACNAEWEQETSNLIMPFLVQNAKMMKGLTTLPRQSFYFESTVHTSQMHKVISVTSKQKLKGNIIQNCWNVPDVEYY